MIIEVTPFLLDCTEKAQACMVLEEAAEVFAAWQAFQEALYVDAHTDENSLRAEVCRLDLADEVADVVQAACSLAYLYGIDVAEAMQRCTQRQHERGRL